MQAFSHVTKINRDATKTEVANSPALSVRNQFACTHQEVAKRAYEIFEKNGSEEGHCDQNWFQAEREMQREGMELSSTSCGR